MQSQQHIESAAGSTPANSDRPATATVVLPTSSAGSPIWRYGATATPEGGNRLAAAAAAGAAASSPLLGSGAAQQLRHRPRPPPLTAPAPRWPSGPWPGSPGAAADRSGALQGSMWHYQAVIEHPMVTTLQSRLCHTLCSKRFRSAALQGSILGMQAVMKRQRRAQVDAELCRAGHKVQSGRDEQQEAIPGRACCLEAGTALGAGQHGRQPVLLPQGTLGSRTSWMRPPQSHAESQKKACKLKPYCASPSQQ